MIITDITKLPKIEGEMFIVLTQGDYYASTGWEKEGEIGSRTEYAVVRMLSRIDAEKFVVDHHPSKCLVFRAQQLSVEIKITPAFFDQVTK